MDKMEIVDALHQIEIALEKAKVVQHDLAHDFFSHTSQEQRKMAFEQNYDNARIKSLIVEDNLAEVTCLLRTIKRELGEV